MTKTTMRKYLEDLQAKGLSELPAEIKIDDVLPLYHEIEDLEQQIAVIGERSGKEILRLSKHAKFLNLLVEQSENSIEKMGRNIDDLVNHYKKVYEERSSINDHYEAIQAHAMLNAYETMKIYFNQIFRKDDNED